jgi:hypothetical protein
VKTQICNQKVVHGAAPRKSSRPPWQRCACQCQSLIAPATNRGASACAWVVRFPHP